MRKIIVLFIMTVLCAGNANAQDNSTALLSLKKSPSYPEATAPAAVKAKNFAILANENFKRDFKNAQNVQWVEKADGYRVRFEENATRCAVDYTIKGTIYSTIRYGQSLLTAELKKELDRTFSNFTLREVSEIKMAGYRSIAYVIILEDRLSVKTLRIIEGNIEVIQDLQK